MVFDLFLTIRLWLPLDDFDRLCLRTGKELLMPAHVRGYSSIVEEFRKARLLERLEAALLPFHRMLEEKCLHRSTAGILAYSS